MLKFLCLQLVEHNAASSKIFTWNDLINSIRNPQGAQSVCHLGQSSLLDVPGHGSYSSR